MHPPRSSRSARARKPTHARRRPPAVDIVIPIYNEAEVFEQTAAHTPLRRVAEPEDISRVVIFLASEMSDYLTGQYIPANGGAFML